MSVAHRASLALVLALSAGPSAASAEEASWAEGLKSRLEALDRASPGELGVWVKRLADEEEVGHQAGRAWYLSSTIKVPVAVALLEQVEAGAISLGQELTLEASDFVDGAGELQATAPGTRLSVASLLERMLVQSDSTATDMLIRLIGLEELNELLERHGFGRATTILQVRYDAYGELHPGARRLSNLDFLEIRRAGGPEARRRAFAAKVGASPAELRAPTLEEAFERYYERGLNTASLVAFGRLLEELVEGKLLSAQHTALVLQHMEAMTTGERRIKAGLPPGSRFAQKTGTQIRRICNMGVVNPRSPRAVVIAACVERHPDQAAAEGLLRQVGEAVARSGAL